MKRYQTFLWLAVTAVIPLVTQAGCANNGPVVGESQNTATSVKSNDPCHQGLAVLSTYPAHKPKSPGQAGAYFTERINY